MEVALFIGVIFMILNFWILLEYHSRLQVTNESIVALKNKYDILNANVFAVREDLWREDSLIADKLNLILTDVENARDDIRGLAALNVSALETAEELIPDVSELSQNELERLARKEAFDKRIAEMREELGYESYGTHAEELDPNVKNLPHNIIPVSLYDLPDVEIAE